MVQTIFFLVLRAAEGEFKFGAGDILKTFTSIVRMSYNYQTLLPNVVYFTGSWCNKKVSL